MQQSIELSSNAISQLLTPVLCRTENKYRTTGGYRLQTQRNYVTIIAGFSSHHRRTGANGSQTVGHGAFINVGSYLHHFLQRNRPEIGAVKIGVNPRCDDVEVW